MGVGGWVGGRFPGGAVMDEKTGARAPALQELEEPGLVGPEVGDVVGFEKPGEGEEDGDAKEGPEEEPYRESAGEWNGGKGFDAEEHTACGANAGGDNDSGDGGQEALFPGSSGEEEGGVNECGEGEDREKEGDEAGEVEQQRGTPRRSITPRWELPR